MYLAMRDERIDRRWTQTFVAEKLGVSKQLIQNIETNRRKPSYHVLVKLEDLFGMTHRELLRPSTRSKDDTKSSQGTLKKGPDTT